MVAPIIAWQSSLFDEGEPSADASFASLTRRVLAQGAWVDHAPRWLAGSGRLFDHLLHGLNWEGHQRWMYDRIVDDPRLSARGLDVTALPPVVGQMRDLLVERYGVEFTGVTANLYRDGRDSVAWHGDRVARDRPEAVVALMILGGRRRFLLRPKGGGRSVVFTPGPGDLLVMGGSCQRTWDHSVPKMAAADARISVMFRHAYDE
ncbi:MAG: alpha-ketoglutarate-dependent dioxygenase AlkB [Acidimicrobiales bacterium]